MKPFLIILSIVLVLPASSALAFDHQHAQWDRLLKSHVFWGEDGSASWVRYSDFKTDRAALKTYLSELSAVPRSKFDGWTEAQQLAFLINAYNAFTVELILTEYPDLDSIKDLGSFFSSPWKKEFFTLLGEKRHLDWIEHDVIRAPGAYNEPRIHFVVNCASIGCPALRPEALTADRLESQLADSTTRFLRDESRNRYIPDENTLAVSKIFDWYGEDFERGWGGYNSLEEFFAAHADPLADSDAGRQRIKAGDMEIDFLDYDWSLNDAARMPSQ